MPSSPQPLPQEIYVRRRRAAALGVIFLVVMGLLLAFLISRPSGGNSAKVAAATSAAPTAVAETSAAVLTSADAAASTTSESETLAADNSSAEPSASETKDACSVKYLVVSASSDKATYEEGELPVFYLSVYNPTAVDCEIDLSENELSFEVYNLASFQREWSDVDCSAAVQTGNYTFKAGQTHHFEATWSRRNSSPGQCGSRTPAEAGGHLLHTGVGGNHSGPHTFNLR